MKVIFLCTANSARSILAEGIFRHITDGQHEIYSCGAQPSGKVNPMALSFLRNKGINTDSLHSKSYDAIPMEGALLVAVCDNAANEVCPVVGNSVYRLAMPLPDPAQHHLNEKEQTDLFNQVGDSLWALLHNLKGQLMHCSAPNLVYSPSIN